MRVTTPGRSLLLTIMLRVSQVGAFPPLKNLSERLFSP